MWTVIAEEPQIMIIMPKRGVLVGQRTRVSVGSFDGVRASSCKITHQETPQ